MEQEERGGESGISRKRKHKGGGDGGWRRDEGVGWGLGVGVSGVGGGLCPKKTSSHLITWDCFRARLVGGPEASRRPARGAGNYATAVPG